MVVFPNCKINIGLNVVGKRPDGYHDIETVFYPLTLREALEAVPADERQFALTGLPIESDNTNNFCIKAYDLLKADFPSLPPVKIHLHKVIPIGAGLGGGSADAAFMLQLLNQLFKLDLTQVQLSEYAERLGSDCAFFLYNQPCLATGRGEKLQPLTLDLASYKILLINPGIHISTAEAFKSVTIGNSGQLHQALQQPVKNWKSTVYNGFEIPVFKRFSAIAEIKELLYAQGAMYASMTGSGSSVYGIFKEAIDLKQKFPAHYFYRWC